MIKILIIINPKKNPKKLQKKVFYYKSKKIKLIKKINWAQFQKKIKKNNK